MKAGTTPGYDHVHPEFLKNLGPRAQTWLSRFFSRIISANAITKFWRKTKVITIEKPGKDPRLAESYRPISLLSTCYKLLECLVLHCVSPEVEKLPSPEQAGFWRNRSTCKQVAALTTHIANGFQQQFKTGAVFLDLTAAYDTVWASGLLQVEQEHAALVCPTDWAILMWPMFQGGYWRHQRLENSGEWASSGVGAITNTLQPLHQRPSCNWVSEVYLRRWYLLDKASTEVCRAGMLSLIGHGAYGILPHMAA